MNAITQWLQINNNNWLCVTYIKLWNFSLQPDLLCLFKLSHVHFQNATSKHSSYKATVSLQKVWILVLFDHFRWKCFTFFIRMVWNLVKILALAVWTKKNQKKKHGLNRWNGPEQMSTLRMLSSGSVRYCSQTQSLWKRFFWRYQPQIFNTT